MPTFVERRSVIIWFSLSIISSLAPLENSKTCLYKNNDIYNHWNKSTSLIHNSYTPSDIHIDISQH